MVRYCAYMAPPSSATVFPTSARASSDEPARTTTPAPSFPTGNDWSMRPATARSAAGGMRAVTIGSCALPDSVAVDMSAPPNSRPRSDGFTGVASIRTTDLIGLRFRRRNTDE